MHDPSLPIAAPASLAPSRRRRAVCRRVLFAATGILTALSVAGCATFKPLPLGNGRGAASVAALSAPTTNMPLPMLAQHRFDPADGLDATEVAMLAVANSPALKVQRDALGIARAQAFAAGLLPDPQLSLGEDFPQHSGPGLTKAFNLGINEDITALLTRSSRKAAARGHAAQVNLELLWSEWQTVTQARQLFNQVTTLRTQQRRLQVEQVALAPVDRYVKTALQAGNLTYDTASAGLNDLAGVHKQLRDTAVQLHQAESDLHVLLGLNSSAPLPLVGRVDATQPTPAQVQQALTVLPQRRPDLLALQAGYRAQNAALRGAILAQFPALTLGFNTARDTGNVYTKGFSIGINLPLFDRNRGNIAIERATRLHLKDTYDERLLSARSDVQRLQADLVTLKGQRARLIAHVHQLDASRRAAERAWHQQLLDWPVYLTIRSNVLSADLELLNLRERQARSAIALQALLGNTDIPASAKTPQP
ncbi:MAG: TolC family protein [Rhodanobacter sp.]|nr:MAG: TolC family protein [Rhodanobacter sp.]TAL98436.1 MAG: TolC family protein [Rhodanobacter sp.]TAM42225.1 MAG: TolC family protein [Rhodanobacter sp.]TAN26448.1 MAG: TolC family protein [Rhodanobacter sp.]